jgi:hypothetical protein
MSAPNTVKITVGNNSALRDTLQSVNELLYRSPELRKLAVDIFQPDFEFVRLEQDDDPAVSAGEVRVRLQPSERLLELVATLRAAERDLEIARERAHEDPHIVMRNVVIENCRGIVVDD